jgi:hypothetical protein
MIYQIVKKNGKYKYIVEMEGVILPFVSKMVYFELYFYLLLRYFS